MTAISALKPSLSTGQKTSDATRLAGIDILRAACAVLVVVLHSAIPYMDDPLPGLVWSVMPVERSSAANLIGWGIDGFIMPVFFLMNGYFAARLLHQRGTKAFRSHRLRRIGGPFLFGCAVILPMDLYVWLTGWVVSDLIPIRKLRSLNIDGELGAALHGVSHLWFLQYVLVYCLSASWIADWRARTNRSSVAEDQSPVTGASRTVDAPAPNATRQGLVAGLTLVAGSLVAAGILWWQPRIVIGFRHSWWPLWENLIYYAVPFTLGWFWDRHSPPRVSSLLRWTGQLALAGVLFVWMWPALQSHLRSETIPVADWNVPFLFAGFGVLVSTGLFGTFLSVPVSRIPASIRYLSQASFWIYLFHHPVVALMQVNLLPVPVSAGWKFGMVCVVATGFCLLTYEGLVRRTWIGELLNGVRDSAPRPRTILFPARSSLKQRDAA